MALLYGALTGGPQVFGGTKKMTLLMRGALLTSSAPLLSGAQYGALLIFGALSGTIIMKRVTIVLTPHKKIGKLM